MNEISIVQGAELQQATPVWNVVIDRYINNLDVKPKTLDTYRKALKQFNIFITAHTGNTRPPEKADLLAYKNYLVEQGKTDSTVSAYIVAVRGLFTWLESEKIYPNIAKGIKGGKSGNKAHKKGWLSVNQVKNVFSEFKGDSLETIRNYALFNLLVRTGLRTVEVERANIEDIREEGGQTYLYIQGKGRTSKRDFVKLTDTALRPLQEYLQARGEKNTTAPLFASLSDKNNGGRLTTRSISRIIKNSMVKAGINSRTLTAHSLRHTAITFSLLGGASPQEAKEFARHSDINTTMIYAHNIDRIKGIPEHSIDSYLAKGGLC